MEDRALLMTYLAIWFPSVLGVHLYALSKRLSQGVAALSHAVPTLVATLMSYVFVLNHGATVAQYVAGSERGMALWSLWAISWPLLLLATFATAVAQANWVSVASMKRERRAWIPVALVGLGLCVFAFVTVMSNFPDA